MTRRVTEHPLQEACAVGTASTIGGGAGGHCSTTRLIQHVGQHEHGQSQSNLLGLDLGGPLFNLGFPFGC